MNTKPQKKLPYITDEELKQPIDAVTVKVSGSYTKRGEQRKDVYEDYYEAELIVPKAWNMGHVKLAANRHVKDTLRGIRARTYEVDLDEKPKPTEQKPRKFFMSTQGLMDNQSLKREYEEKKRLAQQRRQAEEDGEDPSLAGFADDTEYGRDGLPKFSDRVYAVDA